MEGLEIRQSLGKMDYLNYLHIAIVVRHGVNTKIIMMTLHFFKTYINDRLVYFIRTIFFSKI